MRIAVRNPPPVPDLDLDARVETSRLAMADGAQARLRRSAMPCPRTAMAPSANRRPMWS
jgi:hypothetical protein